MNKKLIRDRFPLPHMDDILDSLAQAKFYTTLDLKMGFFMFQLKKKAANTVHLPLAMVSMNFV